MKKLSIILCVLVAIACIPNKAYAQDIEKPELLIVKFHADWCGSCKAIGSALEDLTNKLDGKPVLFVALDFTNQTTKRQANLLASAIGIDQIVANNNATGFFLVIDAETKEIKAKLTEKLSTKEMGNSILSFL